MDTRLQNYLLTDEALITEICNNSNSNLFGIIYDRYFIRIFNRCYLLIKDKSISADLTQDIFLKIYTKLNSFRNQSAFSTWAYKITQNVCIDYIRKSKRSNIFIPFDEKENDFPHPYFQEEMDIEENLMEIDIAVLEKLMNKISPNDKLLLLMKYQDKMTIKEIKNITGASSESAIKMRLKRIRAKLLAIYYTE